MPRIQRPSDQSYLSVDWQNPIADHSLNKGLLAWWLVQPGNMGGTVLRDLVTPQHDGILTNMDPATDWVFDDRPGGWGSLDFSGSGEMVEIPQTDALKNLSPGATGGCTVSVVANTRNAGQNNLGTYFENRDGTGGVAMFIRTYGDDVDALQMSMYDSIRRRSAVSVSGQVIHDEWHTYSTVIDKSELRLYRDGVEAIGYVVQETVAGNASPATGNRRIGNRETGTDRAIDGQISDVRIYNRAVSDEELRAIWDLSRQGYPGLLNRWRTPHVREPEAAGGNAMPMAIMQMIG